MGYDFNPNILMSGQGVELPDPMQSAARAFTLKNLSDRSALSEMEMQQKQRAQRALEAANRVLPMVMQSGWSDEAMQRAIQQEPDSAALLLDTLDKKRKADADNAQKGAQARHQEAQAKTELLKPIADMAFQMSNAPDLSPDMIKQWHNIVASNGLEKLVPTVPMQAWANPESARQVLRVAGSAFYEASQQVQNQETQRKNVSEEGMKRENYASEDARRKAETAQGWARINQEALGAPQEVTIGGKPGLASFNKKGGGWYDPATGGRVAGEVGPKTPEVPATIRKEAMDIRAERQAVTNAIDAVRKTPSAFSFKRGLPSNIPFGNEMAESAMGRKDSTEQRYARAQVYNVVSSVIKERAGTAQSKQELLRINAFLPGPNDDAPMIIDKLRGFESYLMEREQTYSTGKGTAPPSRSMSGTIGGQPKITLLPEGS